MSTLLMHTERIASAGCSRAVAPSYGDAAIAEHAGTAGFAGVDATFRGWSANAPAMSAPQVETAKRTLPPPPRPEDGSP